MPLTTVCVCDNFSCKTVISDINDGFIIEGNIYAADPENLLGIIGNNFPSYSSTSEEQRIRRKDIHKSVYCRPCFLRILKIK